MNLVKIVYVIGSLDTGGAEGQLLELLRHIDRRRFEPSLVLFDCANAHRAAGLVRDLCNLKTPAENSNWRKKALKILAAVFRLSRYLQKSRPDIVHAILPGSTVLAAAAATFARVPILIGSRRSLVDSYRTTRLLSLVDHNATRRCNVMLGNSEAVARELIELDGLSAASVIRIPNGVDTGKFHPSNRKQGRRYGWDEEHIVFGIVANFIRYKRHIDFVLAAERIANANPNARFLMAGEDRGGLASLKAEIRARNLERLFTIIPGTSEPEHLYPAMDVYICTSATEGLSNVLLEAGASGVPIVATRVGGNPEIILDGYNGFLVEPRAPESIAAAALLLAENHQMRRTMGDRSRERVLAEFSIRAMTSAHELLYKQLLLKRSLHKRTKIKSIEAWTHDR